jgi:hypothetical protein
MLAVAFYCAAMVGANLFVSYFGPWVSPINAFVLIGLDLSLRDTLHERWRGRWLWFKMAALISLGGGLSYIANHAAGKIAIASLAAFVASGAVDALVYHWLRHKPYIQKSNGSNLAGAAIDSIIFPMIAFGAFMPIIVLLQFAAKVGGGFVWSLILSKVKHHDPD